MTPTRLTRRFSSGREVAHGCVFLFERRRQQARRWLRWGLGAVVMLTMSGNLAAGGDMAARESSARKVSVAFMKELGGHLKGALAAGDPAAAIEVCSTVAPAIANRVSLKNGWRVTRVGTRPRNTMLGMADAWEQAVLNQFQQRAGKGEKYADMSFSEVVSEPDGRYFRFMKPIGVKPMCLQCHGSAEQIPPPTAAMLSKLYPNDRAVGYAAGDLRGAISVKQPLEP